MIYVQFADSTQKIITTVFSCPQDIDSYPNQAQVDITDERYKAFYQALQEPLQEFMPTPA